MSYCKHQGLTAGVKYEFNAFMEERDKPQLLMAL